MRVRMLKSIAAFDWDYQPGQVVDLPEDTAAAWCASGIATAAELETAMAVSAPERAVTRVKGRGRG